jgi:hypothetical protein
VANLPGQAIANQSLRIGRPIKSVAWGRVGVGIGAQAVGICGNGGEGDPWTRDELGNVFLHYEDWRERYAKLLSQAGDLLTAGLAGLEEPLCLLCAERRVEECHRYHISEFLRAKGHEIEHLD